MKPNEKLLAVLEFAFFGLALLALIVGLAAGAGWGLLLLLLAGVANAARVALEETGRLPTDGRSRALPLVRRGASSLRQLAVAAWRGASAHAAERAKRSS